MTTSTGCRHVWSGGLGGGPWPGPCRRCGQRPADRHTCVHVWSTSDASHNCVKCGMKPGNGCAHVWGPERIGQVLSCEPGPVRYDTCRSYACVKCDAWVFPTCTRIRVINDSTGVQTVDV